jgi:GNAT superfamily N-acetyltransferase
MDATDTTETAPLRLRDAGPADVEAVVALVESAYRGDASRAGWTTEADLLDGHRTDAADVTRLLEAPASFILLAIDPADAGPAGIVGCCHLTRRDVTTAYFGMFAVRPTRQGGGTGRRLLGAAEQRARSEWGSTRMELTVLGQREDLITWYLRRGYAPTGHTSPWPHSAKTFGRPRRDDLYFATLAKPL